MMVADRLQLKVLNVARRPARLNRQTLLGLAFAVALGWSLHRAGLGASDKGPLVNSGGWNLVLRFVWASVHPDLSADLLSLTLDSALVTLSFAIGGTSLALVFGLVAGLFASQTWWRLRGAPQRDAGLPWLLARGLLALPRSLHEAVWGLLLLGVLGLNPLVAILAIAIPFGAITAKVYAEILDETPHNAVQALCAGGVSPLQAVFYGLLPAAFPALLSYGLYRFECSLRSATVLGLIGAGGLGYQILLSLQSLRYEQVWTFLYALILLVGATDGISSFFNHRLNVGRRTEVGDETARRIVHRAAGAENKKVRPAKVPAGALVALGLAALGAAALRHAGADVHTLIDARAQRLLVQSAREMFPPRLDAALLADLGSLCADTLAMSIIAMSLAAAVGLGASFAGASNMMPPPGTQSLGVRWWPKVGLWLATRSLLLVARALSESIWALLVLFVLFPGILPGAVALGLYNGGVLGRLMAEVNENADHRARGVLVSQGASPVQAIFYGLLPQTLPRCLAYVLYRWEVCIRATAIVGIVGAGGLGRRLSEQMARYDYPAISTTLLCFMALTLVVDAISVAVRRVVR